VNKTAAPVSWPTICAVLLSLLLVGCGTTTPGGVPIDTGYTARGQDSRVMFLIIHYTAGSLPVSIKVLTGDEVSVHYLLSDEDPPVIYRLVDESRRAWHAGVSYWQGNAMLNASSIGIEIVHPGFRDTPQGREYLPYPKAQIDALIPLVKDIVKRHGIRPDRILGHSDVQPQTKADPGPTFPWKRLADEGLIAWPDAARVAMQRVIFEAALPDVDWFQDELGQRGYYVPRTGVLDETTQRVLSAFQMRYRPGRHDGVPDAETAALLHVLNTPP
jgi:N-acetylmuramoyl-L-alanine amidase